MIKCDWHSFIDMQTYHDTAVKKFQTNPVKAAGISMLLKLSTNLYQWRAFNKTKLKNKILDSQQSQFHWLKCEDPSKLVFASLYWEPLLQIRIVQLKDGFISDEKITFHYFNICEWMQNYDW